jgi:6-phospho-beta-glucosidase
VKPVIAILGGSTPFTAALVEALRELPGEHKLRLFGQDAVALTRMVGYAMRRLAGWTISATQRLDEAVDGATIVVNQIRFGGMDGRGRDEELALRFGLAPDETLGPAALSCALRTLPRVRELGAELGRKCPQAWVLNLSNPLGLTTGAMLAAGGPRKCVGLCELPFATVQETCRVLGMPATDVEWNYAGLNHRGFVFGLKHRGEDVQPRLPELLGDRTIFGVTAEDIRGAGALPLKYFRLSAGGPPPEARARFLAGVRDEIARQIDAQIDPPPSLGKRDLSWYPAAVVPMIAAIFADRGDRRIVNCLDNDGIVREVPARVFRDGFATERVEPPPAARSWIERWERHERALIEALEAPSLPAVERALELDPAVPGGQARDIARAVMGSER